MSYFKPNYNDYIINPSPINISFQQTVPSMFLSQVKLSSWISQDKLSYSNSKKYMSYTEFNDVTELTKNDETKKTRKTKKTKKKIQKERKKEFIIEFNKLVDWDKYGFLTKTNDFINELDLFWSKNIKKIKNINSKLKYQEISYNYYFKILSDISSLFIASLKINGQRFEFKCLIEDERLLHLLDKSKYYKNFLYYLAFSKSIDIWINIFSIIK